VAINQIVDALHHFPIALDLTLCLKTKVDVVADVDLLLEPASGASLAGPTAFKLVSLAGEIAVRCRLSSGRQD